MKQSSFLWAFIIRKWKRLRWMTGNLIRYPGIIEADVFQNRRIRFISLEQKENSWLLLLYEILL